MAFNPQQIDKQSKDFWNKEKVYEVKNDTSKPKYYVLDMFPYPSGSGLHVGHPLGYVASDIYARYKRLKGFNVLHPMGFDAFGLPAEQYAIETGKHPSQTTKENIETYKKQLNNIGLSFDWSREVVTSDPNYYKWTQWIFLKLFNSIYCYDNQCAYSVDVLVKHFEEHGNHNNTAYTNVEVPSFSAEEWKSYSEREKEDILMNYRLAFRKVSYVNWCEALQTVLANDEVVNGVSERGGHPVEQKPMLQWSLRITAYAERLLNSIENLDWSESLKAQQKNWIGKSVGAKVVFKITPIPNPSPTGEGNVGKWMTTSASTYKKLHDFALEMRKNPTNAEAIMWKELRNEKLGVKFRRQHIIDKYIPDFVCLENKLIVEIDGSIHNIPENIEADLGRTFELESLGYKIIRFPNDEVENSLEKVLNKIKSTIEAINSNLNSPSHKERGLGGEVEVFTTRPDTIFGVTFMVLAPEHPLVNKITTPEQKEAVEAYQQQAKSKSAVDRQAGKTVSGVDTGARAIHPFTGKEIPVWISDYVLVDYGTGAIMAVPSDDDRDKAFAEKFGLEIIDICDKSGYPGATNADKVGKIINSDFLNGLEVMDAIEKAIDALEEEGIGERKVNYKLRDANFSRQRYWGEPFPIYYDENGIAKALPMEELPLELPAMDDIKPQNGNAPLSKVADWKYNNMPLDTDTMPGNAGSSWYFLRYMDPTNDKEFCSKEALEYWQDVDLYVGGTEHAVGHLMYARFWHKFLHDLGYVPTQEPFKKLINQGMIQGVSAFLCKGRFDFGFESEKNDSFDELIQDKVIVSSEIWTKLSSNKELSKDEENIVRNAELEFENFLNENYGRLGYKFNSVSLTTITPPENRFPITFLNKDSEVDINKIIEERNEYKDYRFITNKNGKIKLFRDIEKMSKSKYNVENPDEVITEYGADTFRMFEMFLGPIENHKPWQTKGIDGVFKFLRKFWNLFHTQEDVFEVSIEKPTEKELKILHTCIKKVNEDIERFSFNTCVSAFMICVNELSDVKCNKRAILEELVKLISPFAPHIAEQLWHKLGNTNSVVKDVDYPQFEEKYLVESTVQYPVSVNGKVRAKIDLPANISKEEAEIQALANENVAKWTEDKELRKFIFVPGRIINIVV